eukprot:5882353-Prymnesium_polylepis.1
MQYAIENCQVGTLKLLLRARATAAHQLHWCCMSCCIGCLEVLLAAGADVNERAPLDQAFTPDFLPGATTATEPLGTSALGYACLEHETFRHAQLLATYGAKQGLGVHDPSSLSTPGSRTITIGGHTINLPLGPNHGACRRGGGDEAGPRRAAGRVDVTVATVEAAGSPEPLSQRRPRPH